jgi:tryptophan synthase alpha chain
MTQELTANRLTTLFAQKTAQILSIYFTAGFPQLDDTRLVLKGLQDAGVDMIEIGMPYSDPVADGETIQQSNMKALENGMSIKRLFDQLAGCRAELTMPILLMGYINPILQFGVEAFCQQCREVGVDGVILPDLPLDHYRAEYEETFREHGLHNVFLITPQTPESRIRMIDDVTDGAFIYMVSSASITGSTAGVTDTMRAYFERIDAMNLQNPRLIGFGIKDRESFDMASQHASGAIVGTAFVRHLREHGPSGASVRAFVESVRGEN